MALVTISHQTNGLCLWDVCILCDVYTLWEKSNFSFDPLSPLGSLTEPLVLMANLMGMLMVKWMSDPSFQVFALLDRNYSLPGDWSQSVRFNVLEVGDGGSDGPRTRVITAVDLLLTQVKDGGKDFLKFWTAWRLEIWGLGNVRCRYMHTLWHIPSQTSGMFSPQGFCTYCFLGLECSFPDIYLACSLISFRPLLKCHRLP